MSGSSPESVADRLAFVLCTEPGILERKSRALVETVRRFGGRFSACPILSYSPRPGREPGTRTLRFFRRTGVEAIVEPLNTEWADYGFGNKVVACAHAERTRPHDRLVFLDSDTLVLDEPGALWTDQEDAIRLRPVEQRLAGSTGADDHAEYWQRLFRWAGVTDPVRVETTVTGEGIYGYWNAGVISGPGRVGFFRDWLDTFRSLIREGLVHPAGETFMDQIALAVTVHGEEYGVRPLPRPYNFPISSFVDEDGPRREEPAGPDPDQVVIAHYHKVFDHFPLKNPLKSWMRRSGHPELRRIVRRAGLVGPVNFLRHRLHHRLGLDILAP